MSPLIKKVNITQCSLTNRDKIIPAYITGELPENEAAEFEAHYFACDECYRDLKNAQDAVDIISSGEAGNKKELSYLFKKISSAPTYLKWGIAAAAVLAAAMLLFLFNLSDKKLPVVIPGKEEIFTEELPPADIPEENTPLEDDIAEMTGTSFEPSPYLEQWISDNVRSQNIISKVISPKQGDIFTKNEITFIWEMTERTPVLLKILDNREDEVFSSDAGSSGHPEYIIKAGGLNKPGLYYWRIEDENEVLYIGKFFIR